MSHSQLITRYEDFIRHTPKDPRAEHAFRAIVKLATSAPRGEVYARIANLADIEGATFLEDEGQLVIWGPTMNDGSLIPPLLWDDFVEALKIVRADGKPGIGVSIGTPQGRAPSQSEVDEMRRTGQVPVDYFPESLAGTHLGSVLFRADLALKALALGKDACACGNAATPFPGFQTLPDIARAASEHSDAGSIRLAAHYFTAEGPMVQCEGYSMKIVGSRMRIEQVVSVDDPASQRWSDKVTAGFDEHAKQHVAFKEVSRLYRLIEVANWYSAAGFPCNAILDSYRPLCFEPVRSTRLMEAPVPGKRVLYVGGVRVPLADLAAPSSDGPRKPAIMAARPNSSATAWLEKVDGQIVHAVAIPVASSSVDAADPGNE